MQRSQRTQLRNGLQASHFSCKWDKHQYLWPYRDGSRNIPDAPASSAGGKKKSMSCLWVRTRYRVSPGMCPAASTWVANPAGSSPPCHPICTQSPSLITHPTRRSKDNPLGRGRQNLPTVTLEKSTAEPHRGLSVELRPITQEASLAPNELSSYPAFAWGAQGPPVISRPPTKFGAGLSKSSQYITPMSLRLSCLSQLYLLPSSLQLTRIYS